MHYTSRMTSGVATELALLPAHRIAERLLRGLSARAVWLFGSRARGDAENDSDFDFLVVVPASSQSRYARAVSARQLVSDIRVPKDIVVLTEREWERELRVPASLSSTVKREGIVLEGSG